MSAPRKWKCLAGLAMLAASPVLVGAAPPALDPAQRLLAAHNEARAQIGVPPLVWDAGLARGAASWAEHLGRTGLFEHSPASSAPDGDLGENLWAGTAGYYSLEAMVDAWVREKRHFKAGAFPDNSRTGRVADVGHYTQLVWRGSREVGCAVARSRTEDVLVCRYAEGGNVVGERPF